jgi:aromatic-L-amino-acid/L-tryptophan decarboxylase
MPISDLEFSTDAMRRMADEVLSRCIAHIASLPQQRSNGVHDADALCRAMREPAPEQGSELAPLLDDLFDRYIPQSYTTPAPGYLAYIPGGGVFPAALADFIADTTNRYTGIWHAAPALVQLEANTIDWLKEWMGFPAGAAGSFSTGGSMATFNAVLCAREKLLGEELRRGVLYTSDQTHHCVFKSAKLAGILPDRVRAVPTGADYRLRLDLLEQWVARDRAAGLKPFMVVSNAGTTNTGAVDPLDAIGDFCRDAGLWHHVDGAYGAFFNLCDELRPVLAGLSEADSLTLDPHKGMFLPYGTGALLVRDAVDLRRPHAASAGYLPDAPSVDMFYDPSQYGPELSRGFPGLRMWLSMKLYGTAAYRSALEEKRRLAVDAAARMGAMAHVHVLAPPTLSLFPFHISWPGASRAEEDQATRAVVDATCQRGRVMISGAALHDRCVGRVCVLSFRTHAEQIDALVEDVAASVAEVVGRHT